MERAEQMYEMRKEFRWQLSPFSGWEVLFNEKRYNQNKRMSAKSQLLIFFKDNVRPETGKFGRGHGMRRILPPAWGHYNILKINRTPDKATIDGWTKAIPDSPRQWF